MRREESPKAIVDIQRPSGVGQQVLLDWKLSNINMPDWKLSLGITKNEELKEMRSESRHLGAAAICGLLVSLFVGLAVWGICPCNGETLTGLVSHWSHLTFRLAAMLISSAVGILGGSIGLCSLLFTRHNFQYHGNLVGSCEDKFATHTDGLFIQRR